MQWITCFPVDQQKNVVHLMRKSMRIVCNVKRLPVPFSLFTFGLGRNFQVFMILYMDFGLLVFPQTFSSHSLICCSPWISVLLQNPLYMNEVQQWEDLDVLVYLLLHFFYLCTILPLISRMFRLSGISISVTFYLRELCILVNLTCHVSNFHRPIRRC